MGVGRRRRLDFNLASQTLTLRERVWLARLPRYSGSDIPKPLMAHVHIRLRVAREIIAFLSVTDTYIRIYKHTYIETISEMRCCLAKALGN